MHNFDSLSTKNQKDSSSQDDPYAKDDPLFVYEGKNDFLLIGIIFLLLSFFLVGGFFFK